MGPAYGGAAFQVSCRGQGDHSKEKASTRLFTVTAISFLGPSPGTFIGNTAPILQRRRLRPGWWGDLRSRITEGRRGRSPHPALTQKGRACPRTELARPEQTARAALLPPTPGLSDPEPSQESQQPAQRSPRSALASRQLHRGRGSSSLSPGAPRLLPELRSAGRTASAARVIITLDYLTGVLGNGKSPSPTQPHSEPSSWPPRRISPVVLLNSTSAPLRLCPPGL